MSVSYPYLHYREITKIALYCMMIRQYNYGIKHREKLFFLPNRWHMSMYSNVVCYACLYFICHFRVYFVLPCYRLYHLKPHSPSIYNLQYRLEASFEHLTYQECHYIFFFFFATYLLFETVFIDWKVLCSLEKEDFLIFSTFILFFWCPSKAKIVPMIHFIIFTNFTVVTVLFVVYLIK